MIIRQSVSGDILTFRKNDIIVPWLEDNCVNKYQINQDDLIYIPLGEIQWERIITFLDEFDELYFKMRFSDIIYNSDIVKWTLMKW